MHTYEHLSGAAGRRVYYRAERFKARDLFPKSDPMVEIGDSLLALEDLSMTGVGAFAPGSTVWGPRIGEEISVRVLLDDLVLHDGRARICRVGRRKSGVTVGLGLTSKHLDIGEIIKRRNRYLLKLEIGYDLISDMGMVDTAYRTLTADIVHLLRNYGSVLERHDHRGNGSSPVSPRQVEETLAICEERIVPVWRSLWARANTLVEPIMSDPVRLRATKRFTELVVTPEFLCGPIWRRSYEKPLGYPGDYQVMNQVYEWRFEGDTATGKLAHRLGLEVAECIATRMRMVQQMIAEEVAARPAGTVTHIASIGSGPAKEVSGYLDANDSPAPVAFTLIDQEHEALEHAYSEIYPQTIGRLGKTTVQCLNLSFVDLAKKSRVFPSVGPQDFIYSVGLVDYLADRRARDLVASLYHRLAPGGLLVIGNMRKTALSNLWPMEFICDWSVNYRDDAGMRALAQGLPEVSVKLETDPTGRVYMLSLRKP